MLRICCSIFHIGDRQFGEKPPLEDKSETHGYCPECFTKEAKKIKATLASRDKKSINVGTQ